MSTPRLLARRHPFPLLLPRKKKPDFKITTGIGVRFGMELENLRTPTKMNMLSADEVYAEPRFSGQVLGFIGYGRRT